MAEPGWDGRSGVAGVSEIDRAATSGPNNPFAKEVESGMRERLIGQGSEPLYYANSAQVMRSTHDVRIQFGVVQSATPGEVTTRVMTGVYMTESHARALLELLTKVLAS